jgi:CheY-like chemotaxis protein
VPGAPKKRKIPDMPQEDTRASLLLVDDRPENLVALQAILEPLDQRLVTGAIQVARRSSTC